MTKAALSLLLVLAPSFVLAGRTAAQDDRGSSGEGALFLLLPVGAQAVSLGRAMTAVDGSEGAFWNPAGLAAVGQSLVVVFRGEQVAGTATAASGLYARPGVGTVGASYLLLDVGDQDFTDELGNVLGTVSVRNHLFVVSGAARFSQALSAGVSFKVIQFRLGCRGSMCPDRGTTATS